MNISHLTLRSLIFELRYSPAFRLWDRAGAIWTDAARRWPALTLREATPNQTRFTIENRAELGVQLERAAANLAASKITLEEFLPYCRFLSEIALSLLEIPTFTRVGFKPTFIKEYNNMDDAVRDFFATGMTKELIGKHFGIEGRSEAPNVTIRFEGEYLGCATSLLVRKRATKLDMPMIGADDDFEPVTKEHLELVYECDYFTKVNMDIGQLKATQWVEDAMKVIRRDSNVILGG